MQCDELEGSWLNRSCEENFSLISEELEKLESNFKIKVEQLRALTRKEDLVGKEEELEALVDRLIEMKDTSFAFAPPSVVEDIKKSNKI